jgi:hypothetical protein
MNLYLDRDIRTVKSTTGKLYVNGHFECFILEDVDRGLKEGMPDAEVLERKIKHQTCIPAGQYKIIINHSLRFKRKLPLLLNVPGYEGIRIHMGNSDANTSGCLLPGEARTIDWVANSKKAFDKLFAKIETALAAGEDAWITIQ